LDLTAAGEAQAVALRPLLARAYDLVLVSPMRRAQRTADLAGCSDGSVNLDTVQELREWDYGTLEGLTTREIQERFLDWSIWTGPWPGGETAAEVGARADAVIERLLQTGDDARVLVVAHGHILRVLAARWLGLEVARGRLLALDTATVSELGWEHASRVLRRWNQAPLGAADARPG